MVIIFLALSTVILLKILSPQCRQGYLTVSVRYHACSGQPLRALFALCQLENCRKLTGSGNPEQRI
ncbi:hypothetical protein AB833_12495 [Chromatiales bacterium (ex Bugula neritina AB1)]|nr:hypothetical protein AB833_12495 [Chromatiales bacterium (ex Bugula neritina AB1)]